ncbi:hypothetical protein SAMN04489859_10943 [Paracoccus alcaliphilus]|uniref:Uncharacterized protein n=1 Tax=Paracoccus alcaliphilus TaxID=34002 RepID=A0A1H8PGC0_9RHOB|nr:hypothetical protein [Paracoccus alcaliphilus]WCR18443.1 hypothetical protein JHW40_01355 [Paracoccus alcaliphilus]SEO40777.1 hypothetical protein SAMN04489859_10943 [Paracoccus alcaliphilus]
MRPIINHPGIAIAPDAALPQITRTPEGAAMGGVPGWEIFTDPDYPSGGSTLDRTRANSVVPIDSASLSYGVINGQPAFSIPDGTPRRMLPSSQFPRPFWTVFAVVEVTESAGDKLLARSVTDQADPTRKSVRMGLNNTATALTI